VLLWTGGGARRAGPRRVCAPVESSARGLAPSSAPSAPCAPPGGDDLAKSPHMARIGNSVYDDICPDDPTCRQFGFDRHGTPTPMMEASALFKMHSHQQRPGVSVDPNRFQLAYQTKYNKVRIYKVLGVSKESKEWVANVSNRVCDAPGSWYCTGQYPPALDWLWTKRKDFRQLEDFNVNREDRDNKYYAEYMARMSGKQEGGKPSVSKPSASKPSSKKSPSSLPAGAGKKSDLASTLRGLIKRDDQDGLATILAQNPEAATLRSDDGRGPLWWAYELGRSDIAALLIAAGADADARDKEGIRPSDLKKQ